MPLCAVHCSSTTASRRAASPQASQRKHTSREVLERSCHLTSSLVGVDEYIVEKPLLILYRLGKPQLLLQAIRYVDIEYPYGKQPFATYIFKYRSRRKVPQMVNHVEYYVDILQTICRLSSSSPGARLQSRLKIETRMI